MRRLAQAPNLAIAALWVHALREEGVEATVQREYLGAVMGQLPPDQCLPEIWIDDETQFERAQQVLHAAQHRPQAHCQLRCGERIEGGFEQCWHCGAMMPVA
jgi:hypothetical protein